jgi:hypothetical protein
MSAAMAGAASSKVPAISANVFFITFLLFLD